MTAQEVLDRVKSEALAADEEWRAKVALARAQANGKEIQIVTARGGWADAIGELMFDEPADHYRIKPEPTVRSWTRAEQPLGAVYRGIQDKVKHGIMSNSHCDLDHMLGRFEWCWPHEQFGDNWRPCGVEVV